MVVDRVVRWPAASAVPGVAAVTAVASTNASYDLVGRIVSGWTAGSHEPALRTNPASSRAKRSGASQNGM